MAIVRWEPFRDLVSIQERMNRLFDEAFRSNPRANGEDDWALGGSWAPAVDIYEQEGNIVLKAELPGVDAKNVDIHVENNVLTLRGERKFDHEVKRDNYHRVERAYGTFARSFTLPNVVDTERINAEYKDGVLRVTLPKKEEAKPKQISISVAK
jgi:HSP20 family protein